MAFGRSVYRIKEKPSLGGRWAFCRLVRQKGRKRVKFKKRDNLTVIAQTPSLGNITELSLKNELSVNAENVNLEIIYIHFYNFIIKTKFCQ